MLIPPWWSAAGTLRTDMDGPEVDALIAQLGALVELVESLSDDDFRSPTRCPGWTVAELVAHCEGILIRLVGENAIAVDRPAETDRVGYYRFDPHGPREGDDTGRTFSEVVRDRVLDEAAGRSPAELRAALDQSVRDAIDGIAELPGDRVIHRSGHAPMTYGEFVISRNVEFVVHTMDLAHAVGRPELGVPASEAVVVEPPWRGRRRPTSSRPPAGARSPPRNGRRWATSRRASRCSPDRSRPGTFRP
jgi:uncharacterized protein (TIGR03083 family)